MLGLLAAAWLAAQVDARGQPSLHDRLIRIELGGAGPLLAGQARSEPLDYVADFSGTLHVWTSAGGDLDTLLRIEDPDGALVQEDDDSGGGHTPYIGLEVEPGRRLRIAVATAKESSAALQGTAFLPVELHCIAGPETAATRRVAEQAQHDLAEVKRLREAGEIGAARERVARVLSELEGVAGAEESELVARRAWELGHEANRLALPQTTVDAWNRNWVHAARTLPDAHWGLQTARQYLAFACRWLGDGRRARVLYEQVLAVYERTLPDDHLNLQLARGNLADSLSDGGDPEGARVLLEGVLEVLARTLPDDHPHVQTARQGLASRLYELGDLTAARALAEKVLAVRSRTLPDDHRELQWARGQLAAVLQAMGDAARARELKEKALEVASRTLPDDHPDLQRARHSLAITLSSMEERAPAQALFEKALEVYEHTLSDDDSVLQIARLNLALFLNEAGDVARARGLGEQVLAVYSRSLPDEAQDLQRARTCLARTLWKLGDFAGARELDEQVLEVCRRNLYGDHTLSQSATGDLAFVLAAEHASGGGDEVGRARFAELAAQYVRESVSHARKTLLAGSGRELEERCSSLLEELGDAFSFASGLGVVSPDPELERELFVLSEITRGAALSLAGILRLAEKDPRYAELRAEIRSASEELARVVRQGRSAEELTLARSSREAAEQQLLSLAQELAGEARVEIDLDLGALSGLVSEREALVAYRQYRRSEFDVGGGAEPRRVPSLCAFVVRDGGSLARVELGPLEPIEQAVAAWRATLGVDGGASRGIGTHAPVGPSSSAAAGDELRRLVFDPLSAALQGAERLIVALDGVVHMVPLDALPMQASDTVSGTAPAVLGERWRIEVRSTLTELLSDAAPDARASALVALGDVSYDPDPAPPALEPAAAELVAAARVPGSTGILRGSTSESGFARLPATGAEARGIAATYRSVFGEDASLQVLEHEGASRESLLALAPQAGYLHIATHGWFAPESLRASSDVERSDTYADLATRTGGAERSVGMSPMLLCGLALAGANLPENELGRVPGLMTAEELSALDLTRCELAVLSACDTNVGVRRAGQGVASLQKALQMAGARSVITSLWKVPDEATKELMLAFYRRLWLEEQPKGQALWEAKQELRAARDADGRPVYTTRDWAAWVLTGDPH